MFLHNNVFKHKSIYNLDIFYLFGLRFGLRVFNYFWEVNKKYFPFFTYNKETKKMEHLMIPYMKFGKLKEAKIVRAGDDNSVV